MEDNDQFPPKPSVKNSPTAQIFLSQFIKQKFESITKTATGVVVLKSFIYTIAQLVGINVS